MRKGKRASEEPVPLRSPGSAGGADLEGPEESTLTPPPRRRLGLVVALFFVALGGLGLLGVALAQPEFFVTAVQAFVGGR